jgi:hypothetical protein
MTVAVVPRVRVISLWSKSWVAEVGLVNSEVVVTGFRSGEERQSSRDCEEEVLVSAHVGTGSDDKNVCNST